MTNLYDKIINIAFGDIDSSIIVKLLCCILIIIFIVVIGPIDLVGYIIGIRYCDECGKIIMPWKKIFIVRNLAGSKKKFCINCSKECISKINKEIDLFHKKYSYKGR